MDPTYVLVEVRDSLTSIEPSVDIQQLPLDLLTKEFDLEFMAVPGEMVRVSSRSEEKKEVTWPTSIFSSSWSIVMANLDSLYPFTSEGLGWLESRANQDLNYCIIGDDDGGVASYIQYRTSTSWGYTFVSPRKSELSGLDLNRLVPLFGNDATGDISTNFEWLIKRIRNDGDLLDFIICKDSEDDLNVIVSSLVAISTLNDGGSFVLYLPRLNSIAYNCLTVLSQCFRQMNLVRPLTLSPKQEGAFLIAQDCHEDSKLSRQRELFKQAIEVMQRGDQLSSFVAFLSDTPSIKEFEDWAAKAIQDVIIASQTVDEKISLGQLGPPFIDYHKLLLLLNLPDGHSIIGRDE